MENEKPLEMDNEIELNLEGNVSKKVRRKWPIIVLAVLLLVAIGVALFYFFYDNDGSEEASLTIADVERQNAPSLILGDVTCEKSAGIKLSVDLSINEMALKLLGNNFDGFDALAKELSVEAAAEHYENMYRFDGNITYANESTVNSELIYDSENRKLYIVSGDVADRYVVFDLNEFEDFDTYAKMSDLNTMISENTTLMSQYYERFLSLLNEQEQKNEIVTVNEVSQECKVYVAKISTQELNSLLNEFLSDAKDINKGAEEFFESLQDQLSDIECDDEIIWTVYANGDGDIVGRDISAGNEKILHYILTTEEERVGFACSIKELEITGSGKIKDNKLSGSFDLLWNGNKYLEISPEEYDLEEHHIGAPNGKIRIKLSKKLLQDLFEIELDLPVSVTLELKSTEESTEIRIDLMEIVMLNVQIKHYEPNIISLPEGEEIDGSDPDAMNRWMEGIDFPENGEVGDHLDTEG